ncbi:hypothetical protein ARMGADRAFT_1004477 [Armillaria gallica]|uniref:Uncharacterized protein n=1 Tax=Armillaria gallica TaxID=47427 RepID=A0A2H3EWF6_ARMGA|nr:hypothetical protein ARMGADRAFT_1004477 [Armillaria gallica]
MRDLNVAVIGELPRIVLSFRETEIQKGMVICSASPGHVKWTSSGAAKLSLHTKCPQKSHVGGITCLEKSHN